MTDSAVADLAVIAGDAVRFGVRLAPLTTYRIGGPAAAMVEPRDPEQVVRVLGFARERGMPWFALGLGSNILVDDAGFRGIVLRFGKALATCEREGPDGADWRVGAGLPTPHLARRTAAAGFGGVHRLIGVPGTVGGGIFMNAGAHGQEFREVVREVSLVTAAGQVETRPGSAVPWRYRASGLGPVAIVEAVIALTPAEPARLRAEVGQHLRWRKAGTPFNAPCCGSVFRNPNAAGGNAERTAGQLIDAAGLKGFRVGGAQVSPLHANYIVNTGGAMASDVHRVIETVRARVEREFGIVLELEVQFVG